MINHPSFRIEPWCLRATELDIEALAQIESVFALSNGHIGWRGNLDEGEPQRASRQYLNGFYELRTLPYAEAELRVAGVESDDRQCDEREADPPARRRRTLRRHATAGSDAHDRRLDFRAGTCIADRVEISRRLHGTGVSPGSCPVHRAIIGIALRSRGARRAAK